MASKISRKKSLSVQGVLSIVDNKLFFEVEDFEEPVELSKLISDYDGLDCKLNIAQIEDV